MKQKISECEKWAKTIQEIDEKKSRLRFEMSSSNYTYTPSFRTDEGVKVFLKERGNPEVEIGCFVFQTFYSNDMDTSSGMLVFKINNHCSCKVGLLPQELEELSIRHANYEQDRNFAKSFGVTENAQNARRLNTL